VKLVFQNLEYFRNKTAIIDCRGKYSYSELNDRSVCIANYLLKTGTKKGDRIAFLIAPEFDFVATLFAIWKLGAIAVPLCTIHPVDEWQYVIDDSQTKRVVYGEEFLGQVVQLNGPQLVSILDIEPITINPQHPNLVAQDPSLILYTSGTTSRPKGVLHTHQSLNATIHSLVCSWRWTFEDHILHVLPLHHTHGLVNKLLCAMSVGATCEFLPKFDAETVWNRFSEGKMTLFMAVPTIYSKLIAFWEEQTGVKQKELFKGCKNLRLMVSGSAALPVSVLDKWESISGHRLLERYGMTEIGMAIANSYSGERRAGYIGTPLPDVIVRIVNEIGDVIETVHEQGEIQIKGASVFKEYWNKPQETKDSFTEDGWFKTGDSAILVNGYYKILGRNSVDIIKSGGYKISALEIESKLLDHPEIDECTVVGIADEEWGEIVAAGVVSTFNVQLLTLQDWAKDKMAPYKIPRRLIVLNELPRNVLGKVTKNEIKKLF
jgi:malonyl-CoA/methylmalonyl-CoA synthetase